jgi:hypothetical protein
MPLSVPWAYSLLLNQVLTTRPRTAPLRCRSTAGSCRTATAMTTRARGPRVRRSRPSASTLPRRTVPRKHRARTDPAAPPHVRTSLHNEVVGIRRSWPLRWIYTCYLIQRLFFVLALCIFLHAPAPAYGCRCGLPAAPVDHPHPYAPAPVRTRGFSGLKILRVRVYPHAGAGGTHARRLPCRKDTLAN